MAYGDGFYGGAVYGLPLWAGYPETGGLPTEPGAPEGSLVTSPGQLQFGDVLLGGGSRAGWLELVGWRDTPEAQISDSLRPQAHGAYPGDVLGDSLTVSFRFLLRGRPDEKVAALNTLEQHTAMDGAERALVVNDGDGPWLRRARLIGRQIPQGIHYRHAPLECGLQFLCADPRRYSLTEKVATVQLPTSSGGLEYPLVYPLTYGESASGSLSAQNDGSVATPPLVEFHGPLTDPVLRASDWSLGFNITLTDGETLTVDTGNGTALLNGDADRLYTIRNDSTPLELCLLRPGATNLSLIAPSGTGRVVLTYRDARM